MGDKKTNLWRKNKKLINGIVNGLGFTAVVIGGGIFSMYYLHQIVEEQHQRIRKEVREEFEKAIVEKQQMTDTVVYNKQQKTK